MYKARLIGGPMDDRIVTTLNKGKTVLYSNIHGIYFADHYVATGVIRLGLRETKIYEMEHVNLEVSDLYRVTPDTTQESRNQIRSRK